MDQAQLIMVRELRELRNQYRTDKEFLVDVNRCKSFNKMRRGTFYRWLKDGPPIDKGPILVDFLRALRKGTELRIDAAVPDWLGVLMPVELLTWNPRDSFRAFPFECTNRNRISFIPHPCESGGLALKALEREEVDVAFAAKSFKEKLSDFPNCDRVGSVITTPIRAVAVRPVPKSLGDFGSRPFGVPRESKVGTELKRLCVESGALPQTMEYPDLSAYAAAIENKEIHGLVGFYPWIDSITDLLPDGNDPVYVVPPTLNLGRLEMDLYVNLHRANAAAMRVFIECLHEIFQGFTSFKAQKVVHEALANRFKTADSEVSATLNSTTFTFEELEIQTVLRTWATEVYGRTPPCVECPVAKANGQSKTSQAVFGVLTNITGPDFNT